jgi:hypothetical protein
MVIVVMVMVPDRSQDGDHLVIGRSQDTDHLVPVRSQDGDHGVKGLSDGQNWKRPESWKLRKLNKKVDVSVIKCGVPVMTRSI